MAKRYITTTQARDALHDALSEILEHPGGLDAPRRRKALRAIALSQRWEAQELSEKETLRDILVLAQNHNCEMPGPLSDIRDTCIAELG